MFAQTFFYVSCISSCYTFPLVPQFNVNTEERLYYFSRYVCFLYSFLTIRVTWKLDLYYWMMKRIINKAYNKMKKKEKRIVENFLMFLWMLLKWKKCQYMMFVSCNRKWYLQNWRWTVVEDIPIGHVSSPIDSIGKG